MSSRKDFTRVDKIRKAVIREFNAILVEDVKNPAFTNKLISVTDVEVTRDLRYVRIFVSIMEDPETQKSLFDLLVESLPKIRFGMGKRIQLRYTPEVSIRLDESLERGARITSLLSQISNETVPE